ncbi:dihydrofolate reductase [Chondrinema litorale]|uniref:dihydrofolate reductase n=1 Tax=Chondrinema litorale TaxID=2994555 RepID=UPI002542A48D|nr:dihydrofolate reductase [Chondrinema litorale]
MIVSFIVATAENRTIGKDNDLPWRLPADLKLFKKITSGHCIIMGRKTYDSIGKPLPKRTNIVITTQKNLEIEGCVVTNSIEEALAHAKSINEDEAFIIGGASIYESALDKADKLYLTLVHTEIDGDAFFPEINKNDWEVTNTEKHEKDEKHNYAFTFQTLVRKK